MKSSVAFGGFRRDILLVLLLILGVFLTSVPGECQVFKYVDSNGTQCFTDNYDAIPLQYRNQVPRPSSVRTVQPGQNGNEGRGVDGRQTLQKRIVENITGLARSAAASFWLRILGGGLAFFFLLFLAGKAGTILGGEKMGTLFRLAAAAAALGSLLLIYSGDAVKTYSSLKEDLMGIQQKKQEHDMRVIEAGADPSPVRKK